MCDDDEELCLRVCAGCYKIYYQKLVKKNVIRKIGKVFSEELPPHIVEDDELPWHAAYTS